jgi:hypothetical protein
VTTTNYIDPKLAIWLKEHYAGNVERMESQIIFGSNKTKGFNNQNVLSNNLKIVTCDVFTLTHW